MNALAVSTNANVIPVDFRAVGPAVETDFVIASTPKSELAQRLHAEALHQTAIADTKRAKNGRLSNLSVSTTDIVYMNPYNLKTKAGWNKRIASDPANIEHIDILARSIAKVGVLEPLTVYIENNDAFVSNGHSRLLGVFRAIEVYGAEIKAIPVKSQKYANEADRVLNQIVMNSGKPLTTLETGAVMVELIGFGWTAQQIADKTGLGKVRVDQILKLMEEANDGIKELIATGQVSATTAATVLRESEGDATAAEETLNASVVVARSRGKSKATAKDIKTVKTAAAGETVKATLTKADIAAILTAATFDQDGRTTTITLKTADAKRLRGWFRIDG